MDLFKEEFVLMKEDIKKDVNFLNEKWKDLREMLQN